MSTEPNRPGEGAPEGPEPRDTPETAPTVPLTPPEREAPGSEPERDPAREGDAASRPDGCGIPARRPERPGPRTGPIVWGALILAFCCYVAQRALAPGTVSAATWITVTVIGLGALLLLVGTAVVLRNARSRRASER
ncbi:hypothetical protein JD276_13105 [Leucobacter sp. CSA1]|uniref:Uncharacterized protein n=1 Tax=Leucobacter chromiisoli TaxID=2796471 RepID=A0A934Q832_9MICO|nr:hypothetical protein [Leucobacter chromiisoli]MBK0419969.1 hypothetical protein [Leucobacter chromiisoli]